MNLKTWSKNIVKHIKMYRPLAGKGITITRKLSGTVINVSALGSGSVVEDRHYLQCDYDPATYTISVYDGVMYDKYDPTHDGDPNYGIAGYIESVTSLIKIPQKQLVLTPNNHNIFIYAEFGFNSNTYADAEIKQSYIFPAFEFGKAKVVFARVDTYPNKNKVYQERKGIIRYDVITLCDKVL